MLDKIKFKLDQLGDYFETHYLALYIMIAFAALALGIIITVGISGYVGNLKTKQTVKEIQTQIVTTGITSKKTVLASRRLACENAKAAASWLRLVELNPKARIQLGFPPSNRKQLVAAAEAYIPGCFVKLKPDVGGLSLGKAPKPTTTKETSNGSANNNPVPPQRTNTGTRGPTKTPTSVGGNKKHPTPTTHIDPKPTTTEPTPSGGGSDTSIPVTPTPTPPVVVPPTPVVVIPPVTIIPPVVDVCVNIPGIQTPGNLGIHISLGVGGICIKL